MTQTLRLTIDYSSMIQSFLREKTGGCCWFSCCRDQKKHCLCEISFSHAKVVLYWQGHGCWILMSVHGGGKAERRQADGVRRCNMDSWLHWTKAEMFQGCEGIHTCVHCANFEEQNRYQDSWLKCSNWTKTRWPEAWENVNSGQGMANPERQWETPGEY